MNFLDFLFPKKCLECNKEGKYICKNCLYKVTPCGYVNKDVYSVFRYQGVIRKAIIALKYKYATDISDELAEACFQSLKGKSFSPIRYTLIPIPLFWRRQNLRGFNQAEEIGKKIAEKMKWGFAPDILVKTISTHAQVGLKGSSRRQNLQNVFSVNPNYTLPTNRCTLVLFDDVHTTGSTLDEAKKVLREAGFKNIYAITIAG